MNKMKLWLCDSESYDFREEIVEFKGSDDEIDRYIVYQAIGIWERYKDCDSAKEIYKQYDKENRILIRNGEADGCALIQKIYDILWSRAILIYCKDGKWATGETMNSVKTTLNKLLEERTGDNSIRKTIIRYSQEGKGRKLVKKSIRESPDAVNFLRAAYTIGNFIPVPVGCNGPRGFNNCDIEDYWDLTLYYIFEWYQSHNDEELAKIVKSGKNVKRYKDWLNAFSCWDVFVYANYMQDFVNEADPGDQGRFGRPKELWDGHFEGNVLPEGRQCEEFFHNAANLIRARSCRMVGALRARLQHDIPV